MSFSIEGIYAHYGRYDRVVNVQFQNGSDSKAKFGNSITGTFFYTHAERTHLEDIMMGNTYPNTAGLVKFYVILKNGFSKGQLDDLINRGFLLSDVEEISAMDRPVFNQFADTKTRKLPEPITFTIRAKDYYPGKAELIFYINQLDRGETLSEYDNDKYVALIMVYKSEDVTMDFLENHNAIDPATGDIKDSIAYHKSRIDFYKSDSNEVPQELKDQISTQVDKYRALIETELLSAGVSKERMLGELYWLYGFLIETCMLFTPKTILFHPLVTLDLKGLLHIFLRHVDVINIKTNLKDRTHFQYKLSDVERLIEIVVGSVSDEMVEYYRQRPNGRFGKWGAQAAYYNGDYYVFHISADRRIETFYKI